MAKRGLPTDRVDRLHELRGWPSGTASPSDRRSSSADYLRVRVVGNVTRTVFTVRGERRRRGAAWGERATVSLSRFAGQTVRIEVEVVDRGRKSALRAAVDAVRVTRF